MPPGHRTLQNIPNIHTTYTRMQKLNSEVIQYVSTDDARNRDNDIFNNPILVLFCHLEQVDLYNFIKL